MGGSFKDLKVYQLAYDVAMEIFEVSKSFPKNERYSLCDQIRRSSRSVCANIDEIGRMLGGMARNPEKFLPKKGQ